MKGARGAPPTAVDGDPDLILVRRSNVHGRGVFASRRIRKGTRIIEYAGERVSHQEADRRYEHKGADDNHTFLFIVNRRTVVDGGSGGNEARFINHSCDPNCESVIEGSRIFIEAIRTIRPGEELNYDYRIARDRADPANIDAIFACRCGARRCRGSMLWPRRRSERRSAAEGGRAADMRTGGKVAADRRRGSARGNRAGAGRERSAR